MISVTVQLHTVLQRHALASQQGRLEVSLPTQSSVADLLEMLEIDFPRDAMLLVVNRRLVEESHHLNDRDRVDLMPAISGGIAQHPLARSLS